MGVVMFELQGVKDLPKLENSAFCFLCSFTYYLLVHDLNIWIGGEIEYLSH